MTTFGDTLKELRAEKGITQKAMAEQLNITVPTLSHWECNYQEPAFRDLILLSTYFKVTVDELLGLSDGAENIAAPMGASLTNEERALVEQFRKLSPDLKAMLKSIIKTWTGGDSETVGAPPRT